MSALKKIHILGQKLELNQIEDGFWTSMDSVFLSAACRAESGQSLLDMGCGVGGAGLCVLARISDLSLTGVDIQEDHIKVACENAALNDHDAVFEQMDIRDYAPEERFDHVICNPPYMEAGTHLVSPSDKKARALGHLEDDISIQDWVNAGHKCVKSGGSLTIIHRADAVDRIIRAMGKRFGAIEIIPLWPKVGVEAKRVIVRAIKDRKTPARIHAGIVLHEADGAYTEDADAILRGEQIIE